MVRSADPGLPRIVIERTPANDVYLILDRLLPHDRVGALIRDPEAFLSEHSAELRFLGQALAARLRPPEEARESSAASGARAAPHAERVGDDGGADGRPDEDLLGPGDSLLR